MSSWGNIYYLKATTTVSEIYTCIRESLNDSNVPVAVPIHFAYETETSSLIWDCPPDDRATAEFRFVKITENNERNNIRIVFDKKTKEKEKKNVHVLFFEEETDGQSLVFCYEFFKAIKKFVPNNYIPKNIFDNTPIIKQWLATRKLQLHPVNPNFPIMIIFCADRDGNFFFDKTWVERFLDDLWFMNAEFVRSDIFSMITGKGFVLGQLSKKEIKNLENNPSRKEKLEKFVQESRGIARQVFSPYFSPRIEIRLAGQEEYIELTPPLSITEQY